MQTNVLFDTMARPLEGILHDTAYMTGDDGKNKKILLKCLTLLYVGYVIATNFIEMTFTSNWVFLIIYAFLGILYLRPLVSIQQSSATGGVVSRAEVFNSINLYQLVIVCQFIYIFNNYLKSSNKKTRMFIIRLSIIVVVSVSTWFL